MTENQKKDLLRHLQNLEEMIDGKFAEMNPDRYSRSFFVSNAGKIATEIACLQAEQRAICYTLRILGHYVVYENDHATTIILDEEI